MATDSKLRNRIDQFHSGPGARADHWRYPGGCREGVVRRSGDATKSIPLLAEIEVTEEFHGYPGLRTDGGLEGGRRLGDAATTGRSRPGLRNP